MSQRVVIAGGGRVGVRTVSVLEDYGHDLLVIERDADRRTELAARCRGVIVTGDATETDTVRQADLDRCDVVAALTGSVRTNRRIVDTVDSLAGDVTTVARCHGNQARTGADRTVIPARAGARATADLVPGHVDRLHDVSTVGLALVGLVVDPRAPAAGRDLGAVSLPPGSRIVADMETMTVTGAGTELRPGRRYLAAVEPTAAADLTALLRG